jgi:hypothetical protein
LVAIGPVARAVFLRRERRVAITGGALFAFALVVTLVAPLWLLALGPLVWGVPHLVADVRYLLARPRLHRERAMVAAAAVGLACGALGLGVRAGLAAAAAALIVSRASRVRRVAGVGVCAVLFALAHSSPWIADVVFLQAHNLVAIAFWIWWRPRRGWVHWVPLGVLAAGALILFAAPVDRLLDLGAGRAAPWTGLDLPGLAPTLSPSADPALGLRFVLFFAFAQAAHYVTWLRLVPDEERLRGTPRSFRQAWRGLRRDVGHPVLWAAMVAAAVVAATAFASVALARQVYLGIAFFHAHLELVAIALLWAAGTSLRRQGARAVT